MSEEANDWCDYECDKCGDVMTSEEYHEGNGLCDRCQDELE